MSKIIEMDKILCTNIINEEVSIDGMSNVVAIYRTIKVPRFANAVRYFNKIKALLNNQKSISIIDVSWGDPRCKTIQFGLLVVPNNGRVIYSNEVGNGNSIEI